MKLVRIIHKLKRDAVESIHEISSRFALETVNSVSVPFILLGMRCLASQLTCTTGSENPQGVSSHNLPRVSLFTATGESCLLI